MRKPRWLIIEKPQFNRAPKIKLSLSKYCYLLPTGCGTSKALHEHKWQQGYGSDIYKCQAQWVTFNYTYLFLWLRVDIAMWESKKGMGCSLMQNFKPTDKSKSTIEDFIK